MEKVIIFLIVLVLIVVLRVRLSEHFYSLSNLMADTGLDTGSISDNAREILTSNDINVGDKTINDEIINVLLNDSVVGNVENNSLLNTDITDEQAEDPDFLIRIMDQQHKIFTQVTNQRMLVDNLMNELRKLAKNSTPISVIAKKYVFNNIDGLNKNNNNNGSSTNSANSNPTTPKNINNLFNGIRNMIPENLNILDVTTQAS